MSVVLHGIAVGGGIAIGRARLLQQSMDDIPHLQIEKDNLPHEVQRFEDAVKATRKQLEQLRGNIPENSPTELGAFISLHLMLLSDATIVRDPIDIIHEKSINAEWALRIQTDKLSAQFDQIDDAYLRERKQDMLQVVERIFKNLRGQDANLSSQINDELFDEMILVCTDLSPADTMYFKDGRISAFVTDIGGPTSHTAILGRSLDIPSVISLHHARNLVRENEWLIVDGVDGVIIIQPDDSIIAQYRQRQRDYKAKKRRLNKLKNTAATTLDDVDIEILANIEGPSDIPTVLKSSADGVGLYRSEFLFLNRDTQPDEEEQYEVYSKIIKKLNGKPLTIRTVDLGADKNPRWFGEDNNLNPALGLTGIRLCLAEPVMFRTQMRAILRASVHGPIRMMWPMISSLGELQQCIAHLETAKEQLAEKDIPFCDDFPIGMMIEIPAAALAVGTFLKYIDFISIGTNDLIQYTLAVDRGNDSVSYLYNPTHPAILKLLSHVIRTANRMNKSVSICGEMAGDANMTRLLLGLGLHTFSMHTASILSVKQAILESDITQSEKTVIRILRQEDSEKVSKYLKKLNAQVYTKE